MSRPGLAVAVVLLLVLAGAYTAVWFVVAGRIEDGVVQWAQSVRAQNLDVSWQKLGVGGFPFAFRIEMADARLQAHASVPAVEAQIKRLSASAYPWNFRVWRLDAPAGINAVAGPANAPLARLTAVTARGSVSAPSDGGASIWVGLDDFGAEAGQHATAHQASLWVILPPHPPKSHTEPSVGVALDLQELTLPAVPAPFHNPVDEIAFGTTLMGAVPSAAPRRAAEVWRDDGGTLELDHFTLKWSTLGIRGSGTMALDTNLQPTGAFSGTVSGFNELLTALVAAGRMRANDAGLARLAIGMMAKPGPDGRPEISSSFTIQDGEMFLGPAKLGKIPPLHWE
jgi:hypothetical protein